MEQNLNFEETIKHFKTIIKCDRFIITGSYALTKYGLTSGSKDLDIILVNPSVESCEMLQKLVDSKPCQFDRQYEHEFMYSVSYQGIKIDFFVFKYNGLNTIQEAGAKQYTERTLTFDGCEYAIIPDIVKAKKSYGKLKHILQLQMMASQFYVESDLRNFLANEMKKI